MINNQSYILFHWGMLIVGAVLFIVPQYSQFVITVASLVSILLILHYSFYCCRLASYMNWFGLFYPCMYLFLPAVFPLTEYQDLYDVKIVWECTMMSICAGHITIIAYDRARSDRLVHQGWNLCLVNHLSVRRVLSVSMCMFFAMLAGLMIQYFTRGALGDVLDSTRNELKATGKTIWHLVPIYLYEFCIPLLALIPILIKSRKLNLWLLVGVFSLDAVLFIYLRSRYLVISHLFCFSMAFCIIYPRKNGSFNRRVLLYLVLILCAGMYLRIYRSKMTTTSVIEFEFDFKQELTRAVEGGDLGYFKFFCELRRIFPEQIDYWCGLSYYRVLLIPIPRSIWPEKPLNTSRLVGPLINPDASSEFSASPGVTADWYINFGQLGIIGMALYGIIFARIDRNRSMTGLLRGAASGSLMFSFIRGTLVSCTVSFVLLTVSAHVIKWALEKEHRIQRIE